MNSGIWIAGAALAAVVLTGGKKKKAKPGPSPSGSSYPGGGGKFGGSGSTVEWANYSGSLEELSDDPVARSAQIASLMIRQGERVSLPFVTLETRKGNLVGQFAVSARAATVDGVRVSLTERDLTRVADAYGAHLLTPLLVDEINKQAQVRLVPKPQPWYQGNGGDGTMGTRRRVFDYDKIVGPIDAPLTALVANEGKDWVLDGFAFTPQGKSRGTNYGWFQANGKPIQGIGHVHNLDHTDYSQLVRFVSSVAKVSEDAGQSFRDVSFADMVTDPKLYVLASYTRLPGARHPGVALSGTYV